VAGESLQARLDRLGFLTLTEILRIAHQTAAGLAAAHAQGLVHRDVKPSNILLEQKVERALLTDFGLARAADDASLTHTGYLPGTPHYMSPEQARGDAVDVRSDLFSLGSVIYAMCTGRPPFRADTNFGVLRRITDTEPRPIREVNAEIPAWLAAVVARLLAKQPAKRFNSAGAVAELLQQCLAHVQQPEAVKLPDVCGARQVRGNERGPILFVAAIALTVIVAALTLFFATSPRPAAHDASGPTTTDAPAAASPSLVDWDAVANEINAAANDASVLEQKTELFWNSQPTFATPDESELEPNP
jgi:hypothetical protein